MQEAGRLTIRTHGPAVGRGRIAADDLALLLRTTQDAIERIALVMLGGQGLRRGRRPAEVERMAQLEVLSLGSGSVTLQCELRREQMLLPNMDLGQRALQAFTSGVAWLEAREEVPPNWDAGALMAIRELGSLFRRGVESIEVVSDSRPGRLSERSLDRVGRLVTQTVTNVRTVEGRLLMADFKESGPRCRVHPPVGPPVECTFDDAHRQAVLDALTHYVRVTGEAELETDTGRIKRLVIADVEVIGWEGGEEVTYPFWEPQSIDELARIQNVHPVERVESLAASVWESAEELNEFLKDVYAARTPRRKS